MFRNYVTVALRNLVNHKLYSAINIGGLAVGLAACLLILLFVRDELSYDRWLPNADRIAGLEGTFYIPGREPIAFASTPGPAKPALEKDFSSDIERAVRILQSDEPLRAADRQFIEEVSYTDAGFFEVFDIPMARGAREAALADNKSMILSETAARRYFGDQEAVGQTITANGKDDFTVVGVFRDLPRNTHLELHAIALLDEPRYVDKPWITQKWTSVNVHTYMLFRSREAMDRVAADLTGFADRNVVFDIPGVTDRPSDVVKFELMPLTDIHLHATKAGYFKPGGDIAAVIAFSAIAGLILLIACINFVNLATARSMKRAREVALRKVVGATRSQLIRQHLGEAVLTALIALVVAIALVEVSLPPFNGFLHKALRLDFVGDPMLLVMALGLIVAVGVVGGLYPAVFLSRFRPAVVLKANQSSVSGSSLLRTGLVVFQFAISIALIVCTATVYRQTTYARDLDVGFRHDDRLSLKGLQDLPAPEQTLTLKREIAALPGVRAATLSSDAPPLESNNNTLLYPTSVPGEEKLIIETLAVDYDFFQVFGVKPLAGRLFSADFPADAGPSKEERKSGKETQQSIVINRAMLAKLGVSRPEDAIGKVLYDVASEEEKMTRTTIVGVVPDLYLRSVRSAITPLAYYVGKPDRDFASFNRLTVEVEPGRMRETLAAVQGVWQRLAPTVPIRTGFVDEDVASQYDADAQRGQIFGGFALFAVLIACLGLFGLASFAAERRTKEIGMRKVMGASVLDIVRLLVWQFSKPVLVANLIAWPVSFYLMSRWLSGFRYAIELTSPITLLVVFGGAGLLALAIAWSTIAGHAYRVARASPGRALRCE
jgi:putative ABC transport system permease protein